MTAPHFELTPAELQAIADHKYFLSQQRGAEVSIETAIEDFLKHFAADWRQAKMQADNREQRSEIEKHQYLRSQEEQRDIGRAAAATEWCEQFAHAWRAERESLERNGFQRITIVVQTPHGLHMRPWSSAAQLATRYDCDLYVHKDGMPFWNFLLAGRPFVNLKSLLSLLSMDVAMGDTVEFIATGQHATEALAAMAQLLTAAEQMSPAMAGD